MTKELKMQQQEEKIRCWQEQFQDKINSCMKEIEAHKTSNPDAAKYLLIKKGTSKKFKLALSKACEEKEMYVVFGWFGKIEVWYNIWDFVACAN